VVRLALSTAVRDDAARKPISIYEDAAALL
jgi:hypothetical protein